MLTPWLSAAEPGFLTLAPPFDFLQLALKAPHQHMLGKAGQLQTWAELKLEGVHY